MQPSRPNPICFKKVEQVCVEYENKCNLSSLCFYPTGGLLYHYYANIFQFKLPTDRDCVTEKTMFSTPDIDGYFMIVPKKLDLTQVLVDFRRFERTMVWNEFWFGRDSEEKQKPRIFKKNRNFWYVNQSIVFGIL